MRGLLTGLAVLAMSFAAAGRATADPILMLSSPQDLSQLVAGQQVEIDVTLQGLASGNFIFNLYSQVLFPSGQFQLVSGPTATKDFGSVFFGPDPIADPQVANFQANSGALGSGGGVFGNSPDNTANGVGAIGQNGLYYSFVLQATSAGTGLIGFDLSNPNFNRYSGTDTGFAFAPLPVGGPLLFTITNNAVPEPSPLAMFALAVPPGLGYWLLRRLKAKAAA